jgi:cation diffusion facilitator CzcD-associated flavoprotein CzcO
MPQIAPRQEKVAVVGAGPAGLAVARELAVTQRKKELSFPLEEGRDEGNPFVVSHVDYYF